MTENQIEIPEVENTDIDYVAAIQQLQNTTVSKEVYQKLRVQNQKLLDALVSGQQIEIAAEKPADIGQLLTTYLTAENANNLQTVKTALALRKAQMDAGYQDPFLPQGSHAQITDQTRAKAERVAQGFQHCVDFADGDPAVFTARYQSITKDAVMPKRA